MSHKALILSLLLFSTLVFSTQAKAFAPGVTTAAATAPLRTGGYTCEVNGVISLSGDAKKIDGKRLIGRGMASCKNDQGFTTDYPIVMKLTADTSLQTTLTDAGVKAVAEPFAVTRDPNEMFDHYSNYETVNPRLSEPIVRKLRPQLPSPSASRGSDGSRSIILHGDKNKLFINLTVLGDSKVLGALKIHELSLEYDDQAPNLD